MSYLGNQPATGENNSFKILDDITSYTLTFDGSSSSVVSLADDTITYNNHRFVTGQRVTYSDGGGTAIAPLVDGTAYYIIKNDENSIKLATSISNALASAPVNLATIGVGGSHTINVAFDGVNTKFVATYDNGTKARMTRAAQLQISINGVLQQPQDSATPSEGYGIELGSVIVFSAAPTQQHVFWGNLIASNTPTFDISDNKVDSLTGDGNAISFTLSKPAINNENVLVTIDGVTQYPSDNYNIRAYSVSENVITFTAAPPNGSEIQVRHIGFAGASTGDVTGFYGRTGNVILSRGDFVTVGGINTTGAAVEMNNVVSTGIITAAAFSGQFSGSGNNLSGVSTEFVSAVGIQSGGLPIGVGITQLNFVGLGNTFAVNGTSVDISISGNVGGGGTWRTVDAGIHTTKSVGVNTSDLGDSITGVGNSFQGMYISNGMVIHDNVLHGNHYIGTAFNGLMAGPVNINGVLTVDGNYVVV